MSWTTTSSARDKNRQIAGPNFVTDNGLRDLGASGTGGDGVSMIGIVVAAHGHLATELIASAEMIVGELPLVRACNVGPALSPQAMEEQLRCAVRDVDDGDGVLVLADLIGGTPCTRSMALCQKLRLEVITGANLPMVLKAHSLRNTRSLRELAAQVVESVRSSISWVTDQQVPAAQGQETSS